MKEFEGSDLGLFKNIQILRTTTNNLVVHVDRVRYISELRPQRIEYCPSPRCYKSVNSHGGMILTGKM
jgi:hypothetical protein